MTATVDWDAITLSAAYVLGALSGTVATIAVMRTLIRNLRDKG